MRNRSIPAASLSFETFLAIFGYLFDRAPVRILTSNLHHRTLRKSLQDQRLQFWSTVSYSKIIISDLVGFFSKSLMVKVRGQNSIRNMIKQTAGSGQGSPVTTTSTQPVLRHWPWCQRRWEWYWIRPDVNEALTRHIVKAQLTRHTHALTYAHRQAPANKTHAHTTASGRHCCKPSLFCACSLCPLHSLLARQQATSLSSFYFPNHFPPSLLMAHTWYILTLLFLYAHSCFAVCTAFIKASGRIPAIAMGPDQLGKSRIRLRVGIGIEGAQVATEGLGVRPASVNGA